MSIPLHDCALVKDIVASMIKLSTCILAKHQLLNVIDIYNSNQLWLINLSTFIFNNQEILILQIDCPAAMIDTPKIRRQLQSLLIKEPSNRCHKHTMSPMS